MNHQTILFALAQLLSFSTVVTSVAISAIVGNSLSSNSLLSTLPYTFQVAAVVCCSYLCSMLMQKHGRRPVFLLGCLMLAIAGLAGGYSIILHSFWLNCIAHSFIGIAAASFMFLRFAATDNVDGIQKNRALSLVTFASIGGAFIGPFIAKHTRLFLSAYEFSASYFCFIIISFILAVIFSFTPNDRQKTKNLTETESPKEKAPTLLWLASLTGGTGFLIMALIMLQSSLLLQEDIWCGMQLNYGHITSVIQWHVVAMFAPSLFMPALIARFGLNRILLIGYAILYASLGIAIASQEYSWVLLALILVGIAWNILYVGGSVLITRLPGNAYRWQGINETLMAITQTISALSAGTLFYSIGWISTQMIAVTLTIPGIIFLLMMWSKLNPKKALTDSAN